MHLCKDADGNFTGLKDSRGEIVNIAASDDEFPIGGVQLIRSKAGSVRANHLHRTDWHALYIISGEVDYFWRMEGLRSEPEWRRYGPGECIMTTNGVEHALRFATDCVMVSISKLHRGEQEHDCVKAEVL